MKIKEKYEIGVELEKEEIIAIEDAMDIIGIILDEMHDKGCDYLTYCDKEDRRSYYSTDALEEIREKLRNIIWADSIYRDRSEE